MISFLQCIIFEPISYSEFILVIILKALHRMCTERHFHNAHSIEIIMRRCKNLFQISLQ